MTLEAVQPAAFDAFAADYDAQFTHTPLGRVLRARVWEVLARTFQPGQRVLELACGTGEDAVWLAQRGVRVTATDGSPAMIALTQRKAQAAGVMVTTHCLSLQDIAVGCGALVTDAPFDGVLSNFGGLNTLPAWGELAQTVETLLRPGGRAVLTPMGPFCPWEMAWYGLHGDRRRALRRWGQATAQVGSADIPIWYPSARALRRAWAPAFRPRETRALGFLLPPSYLGHFVARWPRLFAAFNQVERRLAPLLGGWGDHYILVLERA